MNLLTPTQPPGKPRVMLRPDEKFPTNRKQLLWFLWNNGLHVNLFKEGTAWCAVVRDNHSVRLPPLSTYGLRALGNASFEDWYRMVRDAAALGETWVEQGRII